jgi:hypothetical protein
MNYNKHGFTLRKSFTYAAIAVKGFVEEDLKAEGILLLVMLDVKGASFLSKFLYWTDVVLESY